MTQPDIVDVLRAAAVMADELSPGESARLFVHAADLIESLRLLVDLADHPGDDTFQDNSPPTGKA